MKQLARKILKDSKLKIVTSAGTEYSLPALWSLEDAGSYTFRNKLEDKAFSHGGNMTGDGKISGRTIKVEFLMMGATEQDHDYALNVAYTYCMWAGPTGSSGWQGYPRSPTSTRRATSSAGARSRFPCCWRIRSGMKGVLPGW